MSKKKATEVVSVTGHMNENLYKVYEQELDARNRVTGDILRFHRQRGMVISRLKANKSLDGKTSVDYGANPVEVLADNLGISRSYAYKMSTFYEMYSDDDKFRDLLDMFEEHGFNLSWSHFNCLVHVKDEELREELIVCAVEDKLSVRSLHKLLAEKKIKLDDAYIEEGMEDVAAVETESPVVNSEVKAVPTLVDDEDSEEDTEEEEEENRSGSEDWSKPSNAKTILKKLVTSSGNFGDKLVDLVADLTIALSDVHGSSANRDVFKGLSSCKEVLHSLQQQIVEYHEQLDNIETRLLSERKEEND